MSNEKISPPSEFRDIIANDSLIEIAFDSLVSVYIGHKNLGEKGKLKNSINRFCEEAVNADLKAEENVINTFKQFIDKEKYSLEICGEETGTSVIGNNKEKYFVVLDGLDGSSNYIKPSEWSYGTMLAVAKEEDPKYKNFVFAGITLSEEKLILIAIKNKGVFVYEISTQKFTKLKKFKTEAFNSKKILSDNYFPEAKEILGKKQEEWPRTGSTAATLASIVMSDQFINPKFPKMNEGWQGLVDVTRKGNLEQPVLYLFLSELNGVMLNKDGGDIGNNNFKDWCQNEKIPIISAKSKEIADAILSELAL